VHLTRRELDVLVQVASGATNLEVAERLGLSLATSKGYLKTATRKLGAQNRMEAVANARRAGLLP
jgi:DNA-binding CsgD family transcriptional regulator